MNGLKVRFFLFVLILMFGIQSCAEMRRWVSPEGPVQTPVPAKPVPQEPDRIPTPVKPVPQDPDQSSAQAVDYARKHAESGEYQAAINIFFDAYRKQPQNMPLMEEYVRCLDGIRSAADEMVERGDLSAAGKLYYVLKNNHAKFKGLEQVLSFDTSYLTAKLDFCRNTLTKQGFEEYRKGNLNKAIVLWQGVLAFDPQNSDMKDAVRTATQQQKNLQEKN